MIRRLKPRRRTAPTDLTNREQFEKVDGSNSQAMKELMWEYGPSIVAQAEARVGPDPEAIKNLLDANRRYIEKETLDEMAEDNVGERITEHIRKSLRRR